MLRVIGGTWEPTGLTWSGRAAAEGRRSEDDER